MGVKIELEKKDIAVILLSLIESRHRLQDAIKKNKVGNYKITKEAKKNIEIDIENREKLEKFFDKINDS